MHRYSQITIAIHWLTAVLVVVAWFTAVGGRHARTDPSYVHFTVGLAVLLLVVPRLLARWLGAAPRIEDPQKRWLDLAARAGHSLLYLLLIALPLSGSWFRSAEPGGVSAGRSRRDRRFARDRRNADPLARGTARGDRALASICFEGSDARADESVGPVRFDRGSAVA